MSEVEKEIPYQRTIRSFVIRAGRLTTGQERAFNTFGDQFLVPYKPELLDTTAAFGRPAPTILEIGFGMGEATAHIASVRPSDNFLCCEVHAPGVGALLKRVGEGVDGQDLKNVRIIQHDAVEVLDHMIADASLDGIHIFFPDPWHKARHNKRRLIQAPFVTKLASKLKTGGYIHAATDWQNYAEQILEVFSAESQLKNTTANADGYADKPDYRPLTKFENRGIKLGHGVWDVVFTKS
jgi:tRNA (guanine-N7-)-methyltransferase